MKKLLLIQTAGLGYDFVTRNGAREIGGLEARRLRSVFPSLTCTAQATLRTGLPPAQHGMPANGFFDPLLRKPWFWEQSASLVQGPRIWDAFRERGGTVALAFFQQSLGESVDQLVSPAPIHKHGGGMLMGCYSQPADFIERLTRFAGRPFRLCHYWGPFASVKSSEWVADAVSGLLAAPDAPDLCLAYLPGLDYDLQRFGPRHPKSVAALAVVRKELERLVAAARANGYEVVAFGDYAITEVTGPAVFPNRALREAGLFSVRTIGHLSYPDFYQSAAYALPDHQVAMVTCFDPVALPHVTEVLRSLEGVAQVLDRTQQAAFDVDHPRSGDLLLVAQPGRWFAYPWWRDACEAPDYARHVDIHNKPGYDPCELFFGRTPLSVSLDTTRIKGTHGLTGTGCETALFSTLPLKSDTLSDLACALRAWLNS